MALHRDPEAAQAQVGQLGALGEASEPRDDGGELRLDGGFGPGASWHPQNAMGRLGRRWVSGTGPDRRLVLVQTVADPSPWARAVVRDGRVTLNAWTPR